MAATIKGRVIIVSCVVCNVDFMTSAKDWTIVIVTVCGIVRVAVYIIFKVSIPVIVFQRVNERVGRGLIPIRPWKETNNIKIPSKTSTRLLVPRHFRCIFTKSFRKSCVIFSTVFRWYEIELYPLRFFELWYKFSA